jgi:hypothetical protein
MSNSKKTSFVFAGLAMLVLLTAVIVVYNQSPKTAKTSPSPTVASPTPAMASATVSVSAAPAVVPKPEPVVSTDAPPIPAAPAPVVTVAATPDTATPSKKTSPDSAKGLQYATDPDDGAKAMLDYMNKSGMAKAVLGSLDPNSLDILPPLAVYTMEVAPILAGDGLEAAHLQGYQYLVESSGQFIATALYKGVVINFGNGTVGPNYTIDGEATALALQQLARLDQVTAGSYEPRILRLPYISTSRHSTLIWLKSNTDSPDLFYIPPNQIMPDPLEDENLYTADEFFKLALPIMQKGQEAMQKAMPPMGGGNSAN